MFIASFLLCPLPRRLPCCFHDLPSLCPSRDILPIHFLRYPSPFLASSSPPLPSFLHELKHSLSLFLQPCSVCSEEVGNLPLPHSSLVFFCDLSSHDEVVLEMDAARRADRDDDLALFHEMQRRERERKNGAMRPVSDPNAPDPTHGKSATSTLYKMAASAVASTTYRGRTVTEELLASDMGKNDYDWLLTPPGTPLVTGVENESAGDGGYLKGNVVKSLAAIKTNQQPSITSRPELASRTRTNLYGLGNASNRRSSLAPANSMPSSRSGSRPSTPTSRPTISSSISSTGSGGVRQNNVSGPAAKSGIPSRSTTPLRRPVMSHEQLAPGRSSSASKAASLPSRNAPASRGSSPTVRPRAWQPSAMPGFALEPPPNLRTTVPTRSISNSRGASVGGARVGATVTAAPSVSTKPGTCASPSTGPLRPGAFSSPSLGPSRPATSLSSNGSCKPVSSSRAVTSSLSSRPASPSRPTTATIKVTESVPDRSRRQYSSPSVTRGRTSTSERPVSRSGRGDGNTNDAVGKGSKMSDRIIQSGRTAASSMSPEEMQSSRLKRIVKPTTPTAKDNSIFGKNLPRKSIDLALRHMDIRQGAVNGTRPLGTNMPSSAFYSVRSANGRAVRPGHSPMTTSSTVSSDHSMSMIRDLDGSELGEDVCSEAGSKASPRSVTDSSYSINKDVRLCNWINSPDFREDNVELLQLYRPSVEKLSRSDFPFACQHGNASSSCDLCNIKNRLQSLKASPMSAESMRLSPYSCSSNGVLSPSGSHVREVASFSMGGFHDDKKSMSSWKLSEAKLQGGG